MLGELVKEGMEKHQLILKDICDVFNVINWKQAKALVCSGLGKALTKILEMDIFCSILDHSIFKDIIEDPKLSVFLKEDKIVELLCEFANLERATEKEKGGSNVFCDLANYGKGLGTAMKLFNFTLSSNTLDFFKEEASKNNCELKEKQINRCAESFSQETKEDKIKKSEKMARENFSRFKKIFLDLARDVNKNTEKKEEKGFFSFFFKSGDYFVRHDIEKGKQQGKSEFDKQNNKQEKIKKSEIKESEIKIMIEYLTNDE